MFAPWLRKPLQLPRNCGPDAGIRSESAVVINGHMPNNSREDEKQEPKGLGEHARGPAAEKAHELGWDLNEKERTKPASGPQPFDGGVGYDYGAQDFGDVPERVDVPRSDTEAAEEESDRSPRKKAS
jgi:hypothetical protein